MPNWCSNNLCLTHEDPEMIARAVNGFKNCAFLGEFIPVPEDLIDTASGSVGDPDEQAKLVAKTKANIDKHGYGTWYDFCVNEWGTKWDVGADGSEPDVSPDGTVLNLYFDSAWAPPIAAYEKLQDLGFDVRACYYESGMAFAGIYDENGDDYYDLSDMNSDDVRNNIPQELDDTFGISETIAEYEAENQEPFTEWYFQGVKDKGLNNE